LHGAELAEDAGAPHPALAALHAAVDGAPGLSDAQRKTYREATARVVGRMPAAARDDLHKRLPGGANFYADGKAAALGAADAMLASPRVGEPEKANLRAFREQVERGIIPAAGAFDAATGSVHLDGDAGAETAMAGAYAGPGGVLPTHHVHAHELAHALDGQRLDETGTRLVGGHSDSDGWRAAYAAEIDRDGNPLTDYARAMPAEGFAEFGRLLYSGDHDLAEIEQKFPQASAYWKQAGLWPEGEATAGKPVGEFPEAFDREKRVELGATGHADVARPADPSAPGGKTAVLREAVSQLVADGATDADVLAVLGRGPGRESVARVLGEVRGGSSKPEAPAADNPVDNPTAAPVAADAGGITAYHGTSREFGQFDPDKAGSNIDAGYYGRGVYFTTSPDTAKYYARSGAGRAADAKRSVHTVALDLKNPYDFGAKTKLAGTRGESLGMGGTEGSGIPEKDGLRAAVYERAGLTPPGPDDEPDFTAEKKLADALREELIARGHDGVVATLPDGHKEYVAFHGHQARITGTEAVGLTDDAPSPPDLAPPASPAPAAKKPAKEAEWDVRERARQAGVPDWHKAPVRQLRAALAGGPPASPATPPAAPAGTPPPSHGTTGTDHPLAGLDEDAKWKKLAELSHYDAGQAHREALAAKGMPRGIDADEFAADVHRAIAAADGTGLGAARVEPVYQLVGKKYGLTKAEFVQALTHLHDPETGGGRMGAPGASFGTDLLRREGYDPELIVPDRKGPANDLRLPNHLKGDAVAQGRLRAEAEAAFAPAPEPAPAKPTPAAHPALAHAAALPAGSPARAAIEAAAATYAGAGQPTTPHSAVNALMRDVAAMTPDEARAAGAAMNFDPKNLTGDPRHELVKRIHDRRSAAIRSRMTARPESKQGKRDAAEVARMADEPLLAPDELFGPGPAEPRGGTSQAGAWPFAARTSRR
jgi:hypothetical protein